MNLLGILTRERTRASACRIVSGKMSFASSNLLETMEYIEKDDQTLLFRVCRVSFTIEITCRHTWRYIFFYLNMHTHQHTTQ